MSVQLISVQLHTVDQFNFMGRLVGDKQDPVRKETYQYVVINTYGWSSGSRMRSKKLHIDRALSYVNKLSAGGWIDDAVYNNMYMAVDSLLNVYEL